LIELESDTLVLCPELVVATQQSAICCFCRDSEIRLDTVMFISTMSKSIICTSVWSSVIFFIVFWFAQKGLRIQKNLSTGIGSTPSRSSCLYCPSLSSLVVCGRWLFCIVFRFARRE
jgi:hypothetical protein